MSARPNLRGQGYQRKGGAHATGAHNDAVRAAVAVASEPTHAPTHPHPATAVPRTDGRASDRSARGRTDPVLVVAASVASAAVSSAVTSALWGLL